MSLPDLLEELVAIPSVTGEEDALCDHLLERFAATAPEADAVRTGNAVVASVRRGRPEVTLYGHLDTVPEQGNLPPRRSEGRLHGLGASDMKAGLAVMVALLEDPVALEGAFDLSLVFYDREEGPAHENGLEAVLDSHPELAEVRLAVVMEPTDNEIQLGCQGAMNARVSFRGVASHSSRPWLGENAITRAGEWLAAMHALEPKVVEVGGLRFRETYTVTMATGGVARNIVPASFEANLNHRFPPDRTPTEAEASLRERCEAADAVEIVDTAPPAPIPDGHPLVERLIEISGAAVTGKQAWTDVARLSARGISAINFGPGEPAQAHKATEYVELDALEDSFQSLRGLLGNGD